MTIFHLVGSSLDGSQQLDVERPGCSVYFIPFCSILTLPHTFLLISLSFLLFMINLYDHRLILHYPSQLTSLVSCPTRLWSLESDFGTIYPSLLGELPPGSHLSVKSDNYSCKFIVILFIHMYILNIYTVLVYSNYIFINIYIICVVYFIIVYIFVYVYCKLLYLCISYCIVFVFCSHS